MAHVFAICGFAMAADVSAKHRKFPFCSINKLHAGYAGSDHWALL